MSDGMSEYWKAKKLRDQEMRDESVARQTREAVARFIERPDLIRKKNPIFIINGTPIIKMLSQHQITEKDIAEVKPIDVLGKFEVVDISMERTVKIDNVKPPDEE